MDLLNAKLAKAIEIGCMEAIKKTDLPSYIYMCYKQHYYLGQPVVSDADFDSYEDMLKREWPDNPVLQTVGLLTPPAPCGKDCKCMI